MSRALLLLAVGVVGGPAVLYLFWLVHGPLERIAVAYACRLCRRRGLEVQRVRWRPDFAPSGFKTEYTLVQLDCSDADNGRRLVEVVAWLFGVRRVVRDEPYPESFDEQGPTARA